MGNDSGGIIIMAAIASLLGSFNILRCPQANRVLAMMTFRATSSIGFWARRLTRFRRRYVGPGTKGNITREHRPPVGNPLVQCA
jgi:hypothetical protein